MNSIELSSAERLRSIDWGAFSEANLLTLALLATLVLTLALVSRLWVRQRRELRALRRRLHGTSVRGGHLAEALAPLVDGFPADLRREDSTLLFLGQPVDYLYFDPEGGVRFIEVKSGQSRLSKRQRLIREAVEAGRVEWHEYRV